MVLTKRQRVTLAHLSVLCDLCGKFHPLLTTPVPRGIGAF